MAKNAKELQLLKDHLTKNNLKLTRQRENILSHFLKMEHVTAEQMYRLLSKKRSPYRSCDGLPNPETFLRYGHRPRTALWLSNTIRQRRP